MCVCPIPYPSPYIYRREPPRECISSLQNRLWEPVRKQHVAKLRRWGPWARPADQEVGRPAHGSNRPQLLGVGLVWASSYPKVVAWPVLTRFALVLGLHLVHLSQILRSDIFCNFLPGQSVLATCKISLKSPAHILKHHLWNSLITLWLNLVQEYKSLQSYTINSIKVQKLIIDFFSII